MTQIIATGEEQAVRFEGTFTVMAQNITNNRSKWLLCR